jgi:putative tricarboxylic transport membrane protein
MLDQLLAAIPSVLSASSIVAMLIGTVVGILVGALPGVTASMAVAILLPLTFTMSPLVALGAMAGIYNGAMYGGAIPAILLRIPGTPAAVATTFDGYVMARRGEAGLALQLSSYASALGGMVGALALMLLAPPLAAVALAFGPPEMFWTGIFGLASLAMLLGNDVLKGTISALIGLFLAIVGADKLNGFERFTFDQLELTSGLDIGVVLIGLFALPPTFQMAEELVRGGGVRNIPTINSAIGLLECIRRYWLTLTRSSVVGIIVGILPGAGGNVAAILAYNETKRASREPHTFGEGNPEGVVASECANNAVSAAAMIPALTLGVPGGLVAALIMGALIVQGLQPGPQLFRDRPDVVYGFMIQMLITAALIFPLGGLVASRIFARVLYIPSSLLMPLIVATTVVGVYSINNSAFDLLALFSFGLLGFIMEKLGIPLAPASLGLILGPMIESNLRISLLLSQGDPSIFFTRGVSLAIIAVTLVVIAMPLWRWLKDNSGRKKIEQH